MGNIRLQNRYTPSVAAPFVPQPEIPAGTGQQLPNAIENFGASVTRLGAKIQSDQEKEQNFAAQKTYIDEATALPQFLQDQQNSAGENPTDFTKTTNDLLEKRHNDVLAKARASGMAPDQLQALDLKLAGLRQSAVASSVNFQQAAHKSYISGQAGEAADRLSRLVEAMPEALEPSLHEFKTLIDNLPGIEPQDRAALYKQYEASLKQVAGMAYAEKDPAGTVAALTPGNRSGSPTDTRTAAALILRNEEGFAKTASWDVDHHRLGYGSDTITDANGKVHEVKAGDSVTQADAERDLRRRLPDFIKVASEDVGAPFSKLSPMAQGALVSITYNYGHVPKSIVAAAQSGDPKVLAQAFLDLPPGSKDPKIAAALQERRKREASAILSGSYVHEGSGNAVLDQLSGPQQLAVLNAAQANVNRDQTNQKAGLTVDYNNAKDVILSGGDYKGPPITQDRFTSAYGDIEGNQRWADFQGVQKQGAFIKSSATMDGAQMDAAVAALKPTDPTSSTFHEDMQTYDAANEARKIVSEQRHTDSAAYVMKNYPSVKAAYDAVAAGGDARATQAMYAAMSHAYDQLGIPEPDRKAFTTESAAKLKDSFTQADPESKIAMLAQLSRDTGPLFNNALAQLSKEGHYREAYEADASVRDPNMMATLANAERGLKLIEGPNGNTNLRPSQDKIDAAFNDYVGRTGLHFLAGDGQKAMEELAVGLYVYKGGDPGKGTDTLNDDLFASSIRAVVGGDFSNPKTGIVDMHKGNANYKTILPPGIDQDTWKKAIDSASPSFYSRNGNGIPYFGSGVEATPNDIKNEGVFVRVGPDSYQVVMGSDGAPLMNKQGQTYIVHLGTSTVRDAALSKTEALTFPTPADPTKAQSQDDALRGYMEGIADSGAPAIQQGLEKLGYDQKYIDGQLEDFYKSYGVQAPSKRKK